MMRGGGREEEKAGHTGASVKTRNYQCAIDSFLIGLNDLIGVRGDFRKRGPNLKGGWEKAPAEDNDKSTRRGQ